ncbi:hypothetical protein [Streptacidiphilus carbonis]|uniref:hypothetical protein n=1 Tax=Streptacidiphilus carbonis TaxID=105422 RepID=UPI0005AAF6C4|nr:hypothetical protein [Streptacidiphilus carbonis]
MYVLVPDDPVFFSKFQSLEEPLLWRLHCLRSKGPDTDEAHLLADAYDSWVRVLLKLPLWPRWHVTGASTPETDEDDRIEYTLFNAHGTELTGLYPVDLAAADLEQLALCLFAISDARRDGRGLLGQACKEALGTAESLVNGFRRVLGALLLPPPRELLSALHGVGRTSTVTLTPNEEASYRRYCADLVHILSSGDQFAVQSHLAMYP